LEHRTSNEATKFLVSQIEDEKDIKEFRTNIHLRITMNISMKEHWNEIYEALDIDELPWQEEIPEPSIKLLSKCHINKDEPILDVGAGASTFVDYLIKQDFSNIIATDISEIDLNKLKERVGTEKASTVRWIIESSITFPIRRKPTANVFIYAKETG